MKIVQKHWKNETGWNEISNSQPLPELNQINLVLAFGGRDVLSNSMRFNELKQQYPKAQIVMGSTAGEIIGSRVFDDTLSATAIAFEKTQFETLRLEITNPDDSKKIGEEIGRKLKKEGLTYIYLLTDGQKVNGTSLLAGLNSKLPQGVIVTGGLSGDGARFQKTLVGLNSSPTEGQVVAIGFYGNHLKIGYGSIGGWDPFGPIRKVTKSTGNILYELDHKPALALYKTYLGEQAKELPSSGLLFPLSIAPENSKSKLVRTILAVNESENSMTFAGDIPVGFQVQLMRANFERLIDGASQAASLATQRQELKRAQLAILISCVGRKLVLGPRIDEEIEGARTILGEKTVLTGFYSYGELCPNTSESSCELHNQTMTITTLSEE